MNRYVFAITLCLLPLAAEPAKAEGAPATALEQLVTDVLERNPELAFYQAELRAARAGVTTSETVPNPQASFDFGRKRESGQGLSAEGRAWSVSVSQPFEFPGRIALRKAIAGRKLKIAETGLGQFRVALGARARTLGYRLLIAQERATAARQVADRGQELVSVLVQRDPGGVAPLLETKIIEASVIRLKKEASEALSDAQAALFELNQLRGVSLDTPLTVHRTDVALPLVPKADELIAMSRDGNLELQMQRAELEAQGFQVALSMNERWPSVSIAPYYSEERAVSDERSFGLGVTVPLPLWNQNTGNIEAAKAREEQAGTSLLLAQRKVEKEVREKAYAYDLAVQEIARWRPDTVRDLGDAAELADRHYRLGAIPVSTYIELQEQYLEALEAILETRARALENVHSLEVLTGATFVVPKETDQKAEKSGGAK